MTNPNFGLLNTGGSQNALAQGFALGQNIKAQREEKEYRNALSQYDPNNPDTIKPIAQVDPRLGFELNEQHRQSQAAAVDDDVARRAVGGDPKAMQELFVRDPDLWTKLDKNQQDQTKAATSIMGQAAMQIGRLPEEQRAAAWATAVQQAEASGIDIPAYAETYSPAALNNVVARAGIMEKYIQQFEPNYRVIPEGGVLVDTNNPQAVGQFGGSSQFQEGQTASAPDGRRIVFRNGNWQPLREGQ